MFPEIMTQFQDVLKELWASIFHTHPTLIKAFGYVIELYAEKTSAAVNDVKQ